MFAIDVACSFPRVYVRCLYHSFTAKEVTFKSVVCLSVCYSARKKLRQSESTVAYRIVLYEVTWQNCFASAVIKRR